MATALVGVWIGSHRPLHPAQFCMRYMSHHSPLTNDFDITYHNVRFNGSFMHENIFRQAASPEVDAAWKSLGVDYRSAVVPPDRAELAGFTKDHVHLREKYGGGYPANVEGLHHLHCLNLLRKALYYNYDYYHAEGKGAFVNEDHIVRLHVSHCVDILRQQLMCTVDVGVLGQIWWNRDAPRAFVDFNTQHRCRNFDTIKDWAENNQLPPDSETPLDYLEPPTKDTYIWPEIP